ncbi:MAG: hypothetical protein JO022_14745 [Acidobacteriaceae bacterium]|nr:hypothetical protein [Acidobacteriaceae bacterium]
MSANYRAVILDAHNQVLDDHKFKDCTEDASAKGAVKSYARANFTDHAFVELWNGGVRVAKFNRDGEEIALNSSTENESGE